MFNNQKTNKNAVQLLSEVNKDGVVDNPQQYYKIALEAVKQNPMALEHVNTCKNNGDYYHIALEAVKKYGYVLHYVNEDWAVENSIGYYDIVLEAVKQNGLALRYVNYYWIFKNSDEYKEVAQKAVKQKGLALNCVNKEWVEENPQSYYDIVLAAVKEDGWGALESVDQNWVLENPKRYYDIVLEIEVWVLKYVNEDWALINPGLYYKIARNMVNQNGYDLEYVNKNWASDNPQLYKEIALAAVNKNGRALKFVSEELKKNQEIVKTAVNQNGLALRLVDQNWVLENPKQYYDIVLEIERWVFKYVNEDWASKNPKWYYKIVLESMKQYGNDLEYVNKNWASNNPELYKKIALEAVSQNGMALEFVSEELNNNQQIVLAALSQDGSALQYAGEVFRNNIKIVISSLIHVDHKYSYEYGFTLIATISKILSMTSIKNDILLYAHMFNNQNVSNKCKNTLFDFFKKTFENNTSSYKFTLYKNILECYLLLSKGYQGAFPDYQLLASLNDEQHSKQLYTFLSIADQFVLQHTKFPNLSHNEHNHNAIIKNLLDYTDTKIINMINPNQMKPDTEFYRIRKDLIKLVLCYLTIKDLLELDEKLLKSFNFTPGAKLKGKYLDIDLKFFGLEDYTSTGIEALVDAINSQKGYLRNKGEDSNSNNTIYFLDDCLHKDYIELK